jgi:hypothetical protein
MRNVLHPSPRYCDMTVRVRDRFLGEFTMDSDQRSSLEGAARNKLRINRLPEVIVLMLIAAVAIGALIYATLALVGLGCQNMNLT